MPLSHFNNRARIETWNVLMHSESKFKFPIERCVICFYIPSVLIRCGQIKFHTP